jgi:hypothetical protein
MTERSGDCGAVPDQVVRIDYTPDPGPGCVALATDRWSEGDCKLERSQRCTVTDGSVLDFTAVTTQEDPDGARLTGIATLHLVTVNGQTCTGTYDLVATRQ